MGNEELEMIFLEELLSNSPLNVWKLVKHRLSQIFSEILTPMKAEILPRKKCKLGSRKNETWTCRKDYGTEKTRMEMESYHGRSSEVPKEKSQKNRSCKGGVPMTVLG